MSGVLSMIATQYVGQFAIGNDGVPSVYGYVSGVYGTITPASFIDKGGTSRTIAIFNYTISGSSSVSFRLSGTSISNSDTTFVAVVLDGNRLTRASATYTADDGGGRTKWDWSAINTSSYPTSGTKVLLVQ